MARLNAKRRRAMREHKLALAMSAERNPSTVALTGDLRSSTATKPIEIAKRKPFYQRKVDKGVSGAKPERITLPEHVRDPIPAPKPLPQPVRRQSRPDKVVTKGRRMWSKS